MSEGLFAGRYELAELLGSGGMARVQRARDTRMGRTVAVKTLLPDLASDPDARRRFAREAQAAGALNHPGIVTVHDQDEAGDGDDVVPFLVMEYVPGSTLAQLVREQAPLAPERAVRIACDILDALAHAHSRGTVHRDVKPANVLITTEGAVKVADFGIARVLHVDARLTTTGSAIGTPSYMAPEQINGEDVDARSDVYAVGCVLVELLTGKPPFTDGNPINLMYWHVHTPPPAPSSRNPRVPRELDELVLSALAKNPADRPADAAVFRNRLRGWLAATAASALTGPAADLVPDSARRAPAADPRATFGVAAALPALPPAPGPAQDPAPSPGPTPPRPDAVMSKGDFTLPPPAPAPTPPPTTPPPHTPPPGDAAPPRDAPRGGAAVPVRPPVAQPEHPAYSRARQVPLPPPYQPGTPPPRNLRQHGAGGPAVTAAPPGRRGRRRWIAVAAGFGVAVVAVSVALTFSPADGGHGTDGKGPTKGPVVRDAALKLHGGVRGSGYGGGLDGVVRPSSKKGGTLHLVSSYAQTDLLDPAATYDQPSWNLQRLMLRKLVDYAPVPGAAGRKLLPDLATDTGQVSDGGRTWIFHLKPGIAFDTGTPITSKDIKYGIERTFDRTRFGTGPSYFADLLDQGQNYQGPYTDTDPDRLGLKSVTTPDDSTIVFSLAKPFADFRYVLALSMGAPVPRAADTGDGKDFEKHPVASGPYKVASYHPQKSLKLVRNPYWKQSTDPIHSALPDAIDLQVLVSQDAVETSLLAGTADLDLDAITLSDGVETKILNDASLKGNTDLSFSGTTRYLSLQTDVAPLNDFHCRWAVQYAVDRSSVRAVLGGQYDGGDVATTLLPPTSDGYDPLATPFGTSAGVPYPSEARKQLAECGKPDGFTVTLAGLQGVTRLEDAMQSVRRSLAAVGITVKIVTEDSTAFYADLLSPEKLKSKGWGMVLTGWAADWPTGGGFLRTLVQPGGANNYAGLDDSEINGLITKADAIIDPARSAAAWKTIDSKVMSESTMVPLVYLRHLVYRGPRLTNAYQQQVLGGIDLTALGVRP